MPECRGAVRGGRCRLVVTVAPAYVVIAAIKAVGMIALAGSRSVTAATWTIIALTARSGLVVLRRVFETSPSDWELRVG